MLLSTHMLHQHLRYAYSCAHWFHCDCTPKEMLPFQCTAGHLAVSVLSPAQNEHSDELLQLLGIQVVGIQLLHHWCPRNHRIWYSTDCYAKSQLVLAVLYFHQLVELDHCCNLQYNITHYNIHASQTLCCYVMSFLQWHARRAGQTFYRVCINLSRPIFCMGD